MLCACSIAAEVVLHSAAQLANNRTVQHEAWTVCGKCAADSLQPIQCIVCSECSRKVSSAQTLADRLHAKRKTEAPLNCGPIAIPSPNCWPPIYPSLLGRFRVGASRFAAFTGATGNTLAWPTRGASGHFSAALSQPVSSLGPKHLLLHQCCSAARKACRRGGRSGQRCALIWPTEAKKCGLSTACRSHTCKCLHFSETVKGSQVAIWGYN